MTLPYRKPAIAHDPPITRPVIDLALDGSMDDEAIIIDGVRLKVDNPVPGLDAITKLESIFWRLCKMRDELQTLRNGNIELAAKLNKIIESIPGRFR